MATIVENATPAPSISAGVWTGRVLSGLVTAFLLVDAGTKLIAPQFAIALPLREFLRGLRAARQFVQQ